LTFEKAKIRKPEKDKQAIEDARHLLEKEDALKGKTGVQDRIEKLAVEIRLWKLSDHVRSEAKRVRKGETRPGQELPTKADAEDEVAQEWARIFAEYKKTKETWADPALESEKQIQAAVDSYSEAMNPLMKAFEDAQKSNIPAVKGQAGKAVAKLKEAQSSLGPLKADCTAAVAALTDFSDLVTVLEIEPPQTLREIKGVQARYNEAIQKVRRSELALTNQVTAINAKAGQWEKDLESLIREMVAAAVAWAQNEDVKTGAEVVASLLNGTISAVQALDSEPMSALAVQGLHSLVKGLCDGVTVASAGIRSLKLKSKDEDVMKLLDKLDADAFVQMKLDLFMMGFTWLTEPLGLIPNVGSIVRGVLNSAVGHLVEVLKKAAENQAEELRVKKGGKAKDEIEKAADTFKAQALEMLKVALEGAVEAFAKPEEAVGFVIDMVDAALGDPLHELLAKWVGDFDLVDKDQIKETVSKGRKAVVDGTTKMKAMASIQVNFGFDEREAFNTSVLNLGALAKKGDSRGVVIVASPELKAAGVALLIGEDGYTDDHKSFVKSLMDARHGFKGTVTVKSEKGTLQKGELVFTFPDDQGEKWMKDYIKHWKGLTLMSVSYK
jgi:hypothetical protein